MVPADSQARQALERAAHPVEALVAAVDRAAAVVSAEEAVVLEDVVAAQVEAALAVRADQVATVKRINNRRARGIELISAHLAIAGIAASKASTAW